MNFVFMSYYIFKDMQNQTLIQYFHWYYNESDRLWVKAAKDAGMDLIVYHNPEAVEKGINPFDHGSLHTDMWKTEGLKQALDHYGFDAAFVGAFIGLVFVRWMGWW